jgi:TolA-binding protein
LRANRASEAAKQFDVLLERSNLDKARRVDVLYWSAQAHRRAGNTSMACARSSRLLREYPGSALAPNAALLLGEVAVEQHQPAQAKHYLERARTSSHPLVQARAERALKMLDEHAPPL